MLRMHDFGAGKLAVHEVGQDAKPHAFAGELFDRGLERFADLIDEIGAHRVAGIAKKVEDQHGAVASAGGELTDRDIATPPPRATRPGMQALANPMSKFAVFVQHAPRVVDVATLAAAGPDR